MVACRKDSLLWRFYRGEVHESTLYNKEAIIDWLPKYEFLDQLNTAVLSMNSKKYSKKIHFENKKDSIETLFFSLRNSVEFFLD